MFSSGYENLEVVDAFYTEKLTAAYFKFTSLIYFVNIDCKYSSHKVQWKIILRNLVRFFYKRSFVKCRSTLVEKYIKYTYNKNCAIFVEEHRNLERMLCKYYQQ